jgi:hypothetical protein
MLFAVKTSSISRCDHVFGEFAFETPALKPKPEVLPQPHTASVTLAIRATTKSNFFTSWSSCFRPTKVIVCQALLFCWDLSAIFAT